MKAEDLDNGILWLCLAGIVASLTHRFGWEIGVSTGCLLVLVLKRFRW